MTPRRKPSGLEARHLLDRTAGATAQLLALLGALSMAVGLMFFIKQRGDYLVGVLAVLLGLMAIVLSLFVNAAARMLITLYDMLDQLLLHRRHEHED